MRASRVLRCAANKGTGGGSSKSFLDKFEQMKKDISKRVRGVDSSRMLDPEVYRPTPKYGELNLPQSVDALNTKEEKFNLFERNERKVKEFRIYLKAAPDIPDGPEPYYRRVYKPLTDVLQRLYPKDFNFPDESVAEGTTVPINHPPYNENHDPNDRRICPWRLHPSYLPDADNSKPN